MQSREPLWIASALVKTPGFRPTTVCDTRSSSTSSLKMLTRKRKCFQKVQVSLEPLWIASALVKTPGFRPTIVCDTRSSSTSSLKMQTRKRKCFQKVQVSLANSRSSGYSEALFHVFIKFSS